MITIVDYKMGNVGSLLNALNFLGVGAKVSDQPEELLKAEKLILPGVGAFDVAMENLHSLNLIPALNRAVIEHKTPLLGICLGMQILASAGEENRSSKGLGWIPGTVKKIAQDNSKVKVPHVGFNAVKVLAPQSGLFTDLTSEVDFYFVHSYQMVCENSQDISSFVEYGDSKIVSSVQSGNIFGAQFHPEKSQRNGLLFLRNFLRI